MWQKRLRISSLIFLTIVASITHQVLAEATVKIPCRVSLEKIELIQSSEKSGDELYVMVTAYPKNQQPSQSRTPIFPTHWLSKHLAALKDVSIWEAELAEGDSIQLVLTLLEHDVPPWNIDDLIGSAKVILMNQKGKITSKWSIPEYQDLPKIIQEQASVFRFKGEQSEYVVRFNLQSGKMLSKES